SLSLANVRAQQRDLHDRPRPLVGGEARKRGLEPRDLGALQHLGRDESGVPEGAIGDARLGRRERILVERERPARPRKIVEIAARDRLEDAVFGDEIESEQGGRWKSVTFSITMGERARR